MELLEEQLEIVHRQWTEEEFSFEGRHYRLERCRAEPKPLQRPHPPLIMGGAAGPRAVRLAAKWADEYNTVATPQDCRERRARIVEACKQAGREPITFSLMIPFVVGRDPREVLDRARRHLQASGRDGDPIVLLGQEDKLVGTVEEVVARLQEYERAGVERVFLQHLDHADVEMVRLIGAEVLPSLV
jgi:alkanesulfonate monooxygenase SsuD/methylene tetrahydromethanopterin reductase-like flavin-dependent oxidoreductase (luciferase family)